MERLYKGIHEFQRSCFKKEKDYFMQISRGQFPEVLFITCVDSRIDPNLITQSRPGELLILRNVGNVIPPYTSGKDKNSVAAAIEFAVLVMNVKDIIVCGHSDCGAMKALYKTEEELKSMPHLREWLKIASPLKDIVNTTYANYSGRSLQRITEEKNVLAQLRNIQTYPFVAQALKEGAIHLHGWYYDIGTGEVYTYNQSSERFEKVV
jgi:carbonic anhydrase